MQSQHQVRVSSVAEVRSRLIGRLERLVDRLPDDNGWLDGLMESLVMLNALPLSSHEFSVAVNRLRNAQRYLVAKEPGAAHFELSLLLASLKNSEQEKPVRRRMRTRTRSAC